jgi:hypothetical protein
MHLCCKCQGVSGLEHELDIMVLPKQIADECRVLGRSPETSELVLLVECKNLGAIDYGIGREFLGLCFEFPCGQPGLANRGWRWRGGMQLGAFVGTLSSLPKVPSAFQLVARRDLLARHLIEPSQTNAVLGFQQEVVDSLIDVFKP